MDHSTKSPEHYLIAQTLLSGHTYTDTQLARACGLPYEKVREVVRDLCSNFIGSGLRVFNVTKMGQRVPRWQALPARG